MLFVLNKGRVPGYNEGQAPLIYLATTVQQVQASGLDFVFSDGQGIATFTEWFDSTPDLAKVDWSVIYQRYWSDTADDPDRQRRKQAEFLIHVSCPWSLVTEIGVLNSEVAGDVEQILDAYPRRHRPAINVRSNWYH